MISSYRIYGNMMKNGEIKSGRLCIVPSLGMNRTLLLTYLKKDEKFKTSK
jgi:hypothetical protein